MTETPRGTGHTNTTVYAKINPTLITPARLHYPHCRNTIARRLRHIWPPPDPPFIFHTPYNIGNDYRVKANDGTAVVEARIGLTEDFG